tara:strand:- start:3855 stop:5291 length:1437 start_codon:yes stop_codon:yes gene_type:complete
MADETINLEVKSNLGDVSKDAQNAAGDLKIMGVSLNGIKAGFTSAMGAAKSMFSSVKAGLITSGIGVFALAVASLVQYFRDSEEGASKFKQITSQLGVVIGNVTDIVSDLGKGLFNLITGNIKGFKDSLADVTEGVKNFGEQTKKEMEMANQLEKDRLALQQFEREAMVDKAETEKEMMRLRLLARDEENATLAERLAAMREANKLADEQLKKDLHVANEKLRMRQEENTYNKSSKENLDEEARLEAEVFRIQRSNFSERKRMKSEEQALVKQVAALEKAELKAIEDEKNRIAKEDEARRKKEEEEAKKAAEKEIALAKKVADEKKAIAKAEEDFKKATIEKGFGAAAALAGENAALSKGVAAAQTVFQTQQGIMAAMGATSVGDKLLPYPVRLANAIATGVMGAAALAKIMSTDPTGAGASASTPTATAQTPAPQMMSGAFELTGAVEPDPLRAYVVTDEMTNSQNQLANIRRRATI